MELSLQKKLNLPELFGLTTPLLLNSQGNKMGKTESGAIWLDSDMLKPYDYWQYFRNIDDKDVSRFLRLFTDLPIKEIEKLELLQGQEINETKKILATEVTKICHGDIEAENAYLAATSAFEKKDFSLLNDYILQNNQITNGITLVDLLCMTKLESSKSSAKRLIQAGGCKINDHIIDDINYVVDLKTFANNLFFKLSVGKKRYVKVVIPVIDKI